MFLINFYGCIVSLIVTPADKSIDLRLQVPVRRQINLDSAKGAVHVYCSLCSFQPCPAQVQDSPAECIFNPRPSKDRVQHNLPDGTKRIIRNHIPVLRAVNLFGIFRPSVPTATGGMMPRLKKNHESYCNEKDRPKCVVPLPPHTGYFG